MALPTPGSTPLTTSGIEVLERAVRLAPRDASALRRLGHAYLEAGEPSRAAGTLRAALALEPDNVRALNNLGRSLHLGGDLSGAQQVLRRAVGLAPDHAPAHLNLGLLLAAIGDSAQALLHLDRCTVLRPDLPQGWMAWSLTMLDLGRAAEALAGCDRAIALVPQSADAHFIRGRALHDLQRHEESLACCERALALRPDHDQAHYGRGKLLRDLGDARGAVASFQSALRANPRNHAARWAAAMANIPAVPDDGAEAGASRSAFDAALSTLEREIASTSPDDATQMVGVMQPFFLAYQARNNRDLLSRYGGICTRLMGGWQRARGLNRRPHAPRGRRRIGIVSEQLCAHSVFAALTRGWLAALDPSKFEICAFHLGESVDAHTAFARARAQSFEQGRRSLAAWAEAILAREIDVLIYPELGMGQTALQLASMRLAPTQCVAWGHPQTSGLPTMDYYLSAQAFEPPDAGAHYCEQLICLPNLGSFYEPDPESDAEPAAGQAVATTEPHFICAGTPFKYAPEHDGVLVEIAQRLRHCRFEFFTYRDGALSRRLLKRLERAFEASGLEPARFLRLSPRLSRAEFHSLLRSADAMLDTIGFSGFNTVMQALECDLPVVTRRGEYLRGRFGSGILERLGLEELVAADEAAYAETAVRLVRDPAAATAMRRQIRNRRAELYRDPAAIAGLESFLLRQA